MHGKRHSLLPRLAGIFLACMLFFSTALPAQATQTVNERLEQQRSLPIESNEIPNWPNGPVVSADSAILMEAGTGTILYAKNIHKAQYPASCTKILTCTIAAERCSLDEIVTMSHAAIFDTPLDSSYISLDVGNQITMEQALNAILISSANNVAFAVAEHISGTTWQDFAAIMNERAEELGCVDSNFVNPNGLPDENHYTSAYDLAMIGRAFFDKEVLCKISRTSRLHLPPTDTQPKDIYENSHNRLFPGQDMAYEYLVGSKTGYTNAARNCLVSCAEKDGLKLICVVLKDESPYQFEDTLSLFDYGFRNFEKINVAETETKYNINTADSFYSGNDIFGSSRPLLQLDPDAYLVLPVTADFSETVSSITYDTEEEDQAALISYTYNDIPVGTASVNFIDGSAGSFVFDAAPDPTSSDTLPSEAENDGNTDEEAPVVLINIKDVLIRTGILLLSLGVGTVFVLFAVRLLSSRIRRRRRWKSALSYRARPETSRQRRRSAARSARSRRKRARRPNRFRDYDY